ncbi:hypothetical protein OGAPHI_001383 [Ogataea philodendri]|uniref:Uncharacterized protein n=1 Tax=Ogataea philodendri TaxID=1378263 RepID=A0A9P8PCB9_9ASCO|nr:uncharacterized protein OGAPHI_001383 [Ogataea philodendri]KAH3669262.1 hypothetical protein OGAPHI_001383 [Ogataea philodendri]
MGDVNPNKPHAIQASDIAIPSLRNPIRAEAIEGMVTQIVPMRDPSNRAKTRAVCGSVAQRPGKIAEIVHERDITEQCEHDPGKQTPDSKVGPHDLVVHFEDRLDMFVAGLDKDECDNIKEGA